MSKKIISIRCKEIRIIHEDTHLDVYVLYHAPAMAPPGIHGWHYKSYPHDSILADILEEDFADDSQDHPLTWPLKTPENFSRSRC